MTDSPVSSAQTTEQFARAGFRLDAKHSQGKFPLEALALELKELRSEELKLLFAAATKGQRSNRNKALAMLAYARGINSSPICSFLQISQGSLFAI